MAIEQIRFDGPLERLPPNNTEAEEAVLGSVLLDREVIGRVAAILSPQDFYRERNGRIYGAMLALYQQHEPVDYLTLIDELERTGGLEEAGTTSYVAGLLGVVPTPIHAEQYARIVADAAVMRRLISVGGRIATLGFENRIEPAEALEKAEQMIFEIAAKREVRDFVPLSAILSEYLDQLQLAQEGEGVKHGVPTGFADIDRMTAGGFQRSDLIILAARPGMGKTALCLGMARNAAVTFKAGVAVFSLEMSASQLAARLVSAESGIEGQRLRSGHLTDTESRTLGRALNVLAEAKIYIDDTPGASVTSVRSKARRLHGQMPLDLIVVDHMQMMTAGEGTGSRMNRVNEMSEISRQLKALARELHVPVIALSQLSRKVEERTDKVPILSDLRESGALEQDADLVLFIYRDDYYNRDSENPGIAKVHVAKHRSGPTGEVSLLFNARTTRFLDPDFGPLPSPRSGSDGRAWR